MKYPLGILLTALSLPVVLSTQVLAEEKKTEGSKNQPIKLQSTIVGDKEQPGVSYFVPWQGPSAPEQLQRNVDEHYDDSLEMIDRDTMLRSMKIYEEMNLENNNSTASSAK